MSVTVGLCRYLIPVCEGRQKSMAKRKRTKEDQATVDLCEFPRRQRCCRKLCSDSFTKKQISRLRRLILKYKDAHAFLDRRMKVQSAVRRRVMNDDNRNHGGSDDGSSTESVLDLDESSDEESKLRGRVHTTTTFYVDSEVSLQT